FLSLLHHLTTVALRPRHDPHQNRDAGGQSCHEVRYRSPRSASGKYPLVADAGRKGTGGVAPPAQAVDVLHQFDVAMLGTLAAAEQLLKLLRFRRGDGSLEQYGYQVLQSFELLL